MNRNWLKVAQLKRASHVSSILFRPSPRPKCVRNYFPHFIAFGDLSIQQRIMKNKHVKWKALQHAVTPAEGNLRMSFGQASDNDDSSSTVVILSFSGMLNRLIWNAANKVMWKSINHQNHNWSVLKELKHYSRVPCHLAKYFCRLGKYLSISFWNRTSCGVKFCWKQLFRRCNQIVKITTFMTKDFWKKNEGKISHLTLSPVWELSGT